MAVVLEGSATLTVKGMRERHRVSPGSIICSPKNVEVLWELDAPYFKKYWCIFDGSYPTPNPPKDLLIANVSDNPPEWQDYHFTEPKEGPLVAGELIFLRKSGATSTTMCGLAFGEGNRGNGRRRGGHLGYAVHGYARRRDDPAARGRSRRRRDAHRQEALLPSGRRDRPVFRHAHHLDLEGTVHEEVLGDLARSVAGVTLCGSPGTG
jgi:hypothetical protein